MAEPTMTPRDDEDKPQETVGSEGGSSPMDSPARTEKEPRPPASPVEDLTPDD